MIHLSIIVLILAAYLTITESLALGNVIAGLVVAGVITLLIGPRWHPLRLGRIPQIIWALLLYSAVLTVEIIRNGLLVAGIVLRPSVQIRPAIVAVPAQSTNESATAISAHAITVSPGEMVVEMRQDGVMYVHVLDLRFDPEHLVEAQRQRMALLRRILG